MYSNQIMEEFYNTECYGNMRGASGVGKVVCSEGDEIIKIFIVVEKGVITQAEFQTFGGVVAIAVSSVATNLIEGMNLAQAKKVDANRILEFLGDVPENKS